MIRTIPILILSALSLCPPAATAQATAQESEEDAALRAWAELETRHRESVRHEREVRLRELWSAAEAERREAACTFLASKRRSHQPLMRPPTLERLVDVELLLVGEVEESGPSWEHRLALALDLRVRPGVFATREQGRGEALTVYVKPQFDLQLHGDFVLGLHWISPAGERQAARAEAFGPRVFVPGALEMYLRPPQTTTPGRWLLQPVVKRGEKQWYGVPVAIDAVARLAERAQVAARWRNGSRGERAMRFSRRFAALHESGIRSRVAGTTEEWFGLIEGGGEWHVACRLLELQGSRGESEHWGVAPSEGRAERGVLILVKQDVHPTELFVGELGESWQRLADEHRALILVHRLNGTPPEMTEVAAWCRRLVKDHELKTLTVVPTRELDLTLLGMLRVALVEGEVDASAIAEIVLAATVVSTTKPRQSYGCRLLSIAFSREEEGVERGVTDGFEWTWIQRREPAFLALGEVPRRMGEWWERGSGGAAKDR